VRESSVVFERCKSRRERDSARAFQFIILGTDSKCKIISIKSTSQISGLFRDKSMHTRKIERYFGQRFKGIS